MSKNGCDYYVPKSDDIMNCPNCWKWQGNKCEIQDVLKKQVSVWKK